MENWLRQNEPPRTILDFGCGAGTFLDPLRQAGYSTVGMDFSADALLAVRTKGHIAVEVSNAGWDSIRNGSVDLVRMNHVVEHLYHPREVLDRLKTKLRNGGFLHIAMPNATGLSANIFRRYWFGLECPRHVALYPPKVMRSIVEESGFRVLDVIQEPLTKDHIRSWAYFARAIGLSSDRNVDEYISNPLLRILAAVPSGLALIAGKSDRFHIIAKS